MSLYFHTVRWKNLLSTGNEFTELQLDRNKTSLIVGENGAGKTTFLDALAFGLYGIPFRDINKPQLVNSIINKHLLVEIEFTTNGNRFMVRRGMKPNKLEIYKNDSPIPFDQESTLREQQQIFEEEILRMNYTAFKQIVVLGKTNYTPFMQLKSKQRQEVIENLLDIKVFSLMSALLKNENEGLNTEINENKNKLNVARASMKVHENHIAALHEDKEVLIKQLREKLESVLARIEDNSNERKAMLTKIEKAKQSISDRHAVEEKLKRISDYERKLEDKVTTIKKEIAFYHKNDECPKCTQEIDADFKQETLSTCDTQLKQYQTALADLEGKYKKESTRQSEILRVVDEIVDLTTSINNASTSIEHHRESAKELAAEIEDLKKKNVNKMENEIDALAAEIRTLSSHADDLKNKREVHDAAAYLLKDTGIKAAIIKQYIPIINKLINKYLTAMNFFINFEIDEQFNETIKSTFRDEFGYNNFSEGEKLRIDLAILFTWRAIAKMRNSVSTNLLVLDEIFDSSLDYVGVDDFLKIIQEVSGESNIFIISHKTDQLIDKFEQVIKFEKVRNFSKLAKSSEPTESEE